MSEPISLAWLVRSLVRSLHFVAALQFGHRLGWNTDGSLVCDRVGRSVPSIGSAVWRDMGPGVYREALGDDFERLHPRLRELFAGNSGWSGNGSFDRVGCTIGPLTPLLLPLQRAGVLVAGKRTDVAFTIENLPDAAGVVTVRSLEWPGGRRNIVSRTLYRRGRLRDVLGHRQRLTTTVEATVENGAVHLVSRDLAVRVLSRWIEVPGIIAPTTVTTHRFLPTRDRHHIDVTIRLPLIGTVFIYRGYFTAHARP